MTAAAQLTELVRIEQARIGADTVKQMFAVWPLLDPSDIDNSFEIWLQVVKPLVQAQRTKSAQLAGQYLTAYRTLELGTDPAFVPVASTALETAAFDTSMLVTGPIKLRTSLGAGKTLAQAAEDAQVASARSAMRHAVNGGRDTIITNTGTDEKALGWARAASGKACHFCAMLAARGPVYRSEASAHFHAHDGCHCGVQPVYSRTADWPSGSRQYADLWRQSTKGLSGPDAVNAFRRALNA